MEQKKLVWLVGVRSETDRTALYLLSSMKFEVRTFLESCLCRNGCNTFHTEVMSEADKKKLVMRFLTLFAMSQISKFILPEHLAMIISN
jgi:predicted ATP-grasp superfamily ATP-dependent carboligase